MRHAPADLLSPSGCQSPFLMKTSATWIKVLLGLHLTSPLLPGPVPTRHTQRTDRGMVSRQPKCDYKRATVQTRTGMELTWTPLPGPGLTLPARGFPFSPNPSPSYPISLHSHPISLFLSPYTLETQDVKQTRVKPRSRHDFPKPLGHRNSSFCKDLLTHSRRPLLAP